MSATGGYRPTGQSWQRPRWTTLDDYLQHHDSHIRRLEDDYGIQSGLSVTTAGPFSFVLSGRIECRDGLFLDVEKIIDMREDGLVCPTYYKYQACLGRGDTVHEVFRYDTDHSERPHKGHPDPFHCHDVNGVVRWVGIENWPTLADVIIELHEWWEAEGKHRKW